MLSSKFWYISLINPDTLSENLSITSKSYKFVIALSVTLTTNLDVSKKN